MQYIIKFLFIFLFLFFAHQQSNAQQNPIVSVKTIDVDEDPQLIIYHKLRPLTIADFKGHPPTITKGVAATYSGIKMGYSSTYSPSTKITTVAIDLTCYFNPSKSWMKKAGKTERVLAHEQGHFDLTYIQVRKLETAILNYSFTPNWKTELLRLRQKHIDELAEIQALYDKTTYHGTIEEEQKLYEIQINKELSAIKADSE